MAVTKSIKLLYSSTVADMQTKIDAEITRVTGGGGSVDDVQVTGVNSGIQGQIQAILAESSGAGGAVSAAKLFGGTDAGAVQTDVNTYMAGITPVGVFVNGVSNGINGSILVTVLS